MNRVDNINYNTSLMNVGNTIILCYIHIRVGVFNDHVRERDK